MRGALAVLGALVLCSPARAEIRLAGIGWQRLVKHQGRSAGFETLPAVSLSGSTDSRRLRAKLTLLNGGPKSAEGILLRYCFAARLVPREGRAAGVWAVPFMIEEKRVPKLGPNQSQEVALEPSLWGMYLRRLARTGFWPDRLRLQVMLEPRAGETAELQYLQSDLEVTR